MVKLYETEPLYEKIVYYDEFKQTQIRLVINTFRDVEYLSLRKYYLDFEGEDWLPTPEGISMPLDFDNARELFSGLIEILSLAESKEILEDNFKDLLDLIYIQ